MKRDKDFQTGRGILDALARFPWWLGVGLALVSHWLLSALATRPLDALAGAGNAGSTVGVASTFGLAAVVKGLATGLQYAIPIVCLVGAALSAWRRWHRARLLADAAQGEGGASVIDGMSWQDFERLVGEAFARQGYEVAETVATAGGAPGGRGDGGVDLVLRRAAVNGAERTLVQCKHWRAQAVGVDVVRELYGVMAARGAAAGIVVTSGRFTEEATSFAQGRNLRLIDGKQLRRLIQPPADSAKSDNPANSAIPAATAQADQQHAPPACPACGKPMVQRTARRGAQAGRAFWGCSAYPGCRGTRSLSPGP